MKLEIPSIVKEVKKGESTTPRTSLSLYKNVSDSPHKEIRAMLKPEFSTFSDLDIVAKWMDTTSPNRMVELILYTAMKELKYNIETPAPAPKK
jgi:hypothetical protein